jgi:hypothetical protein
MLQQLSYTNEKRSFHLGAPGIMVRHVFLIGTPISGVSP